MTKEIPAVSTCYQSDTVRLVLYCISLTLPQIYVALGSFGIDLYA